MEGKIILLIWLVLFYIMLRYYKKKRKPVRFASFGIFFGLASLIILNIYGYKIGYTVQINVFNILTALILGAPGILLIYAVNAFI